MDYEPDQAIPKAGACSLVARRAAVSGSTSFHGPCLVKEVDTILARPGRGSQSLRTHLDALSLTDTKEGTRVKQADRPMFCKTVYPKLIGAIMPIGVVTWPLALHDRTAYLFKT